MTDLEGLALFCDGDGRITGVIVDTLSLDTRPAAGARLEDLFDVGSRSKVGFLLETIRSRSAAFGWELNASLRGTVRTLHVGGGSAGGELLILASVSPSDVGKLYEQLMEINNEQANAFRMVMKDHLGALGVGAARDAKLYEEITRLNGELATQQRELAKKNVQLRSLIEQRDQLLGMAAHDLRNPLGTVLNFSQFLMDDLSSSLSDEHREFLEIIQTQSRFMLNMVNELLDISKIEAGKLDLNRMDLDIPSVLAHNLAMNRPLARKKNIELAVESEPGLPEASIDPERMAQVLNNLISNAIKYSHRGSRIEVRVCAAQGGGINVEVRDKGVGIPADKLDRLFRPFGRVASEGTAGETSTGLGLAIVRKIVEAHGGRIDVESEVGVGSVFTVWLPA
ncbi:MAG: sensor histidine kinase [Myxococcota bacterium]